MAKHTKARAFERLCVQCGRAFITGASIMKMCSPECRVRAAALSFQHSDECWNWPRSLNPHTGYGQLSAWANGKRILLTAHRVSHAAFIGPVTDGLHVLHRCDNRACFNPAHLFLGTQKDNMDDMEAKGRSNRVAPKIPWSKLNPQKMPRGKDHHLVKDSSCLPRGEKHHATKVTAEDVRLIRASDLTLNELGRQYDMTAAGISAIRNRKTWKHVL